MPPCSRRAQTKEKNKDVPKMKNEAIQPPVLDMVNSERGFPWMLTGVAPPVLYPPPRAVRRSSDSRKYIASLFLLWDSEFVSRPPTGGVLCLISGDLISLAPIPAVANHCACRGSDVPMIYSTWPPNSVHLHSIPHYFLVC